jgi:hypothetical protein
MGLDGDDIGTAIYRAAVYQAAMRISIRNLEDMNPKKIQVVDKTTAIWLGALIANSVVEKLPGDDPVPEDRRRVCKPKATAERSNNYRQRIKQELISGLDRVNGIDVMPTNAILYREDAVSRATGVGTIFHDKFSQYGLSTKGISVDAFRELLAEAHKQVIGAKDGRRLISPGVYDPNLGDTCRGLQNLVHLSGVWMDNDGGDLTPQEFAQMLRVPLVVFNTFSSTQAELRWRVWIPTSHLLTPEAHKELIGQIRKMLIDRKFYGKRYIAQHPDRQIKCHGFDEGKFSAASLFYLPAQAEAGEAASFFLECNWDCELLNPYRWIDRSIIDHREPVIVKAPKTLADVLDTANATKTDKAEENWRAHATGDGNRAFWNLAVAYFHAGLSWCEAEPLLTRQAQWAHGKESVANRVADLKRYRRKIGGT